ncbi:MAG: hypothetical protein OXR73_09630 [Myxococcales bacterium]|nr:hypothetical protein [Myxococcales bacterium]
MGVRCGFWGLCMAACLVACAEGKPTDLGRPRAGRARPAQLADEGGSGEPTGTLQAGAQAPPQEPVGYMGESCRVGAQVPCECPDGGSSGVKTCVEDEGSPTGGSYGGCQGCAGSGVQEVPVDPNMPPCTNGVRDGEESDVDCGGVCTPCEVGRSCVRGIDCDSLNCEGGTCGEAKDPEPVPVTSPPAGQGGSSCDGPCTNSCFPVGVLPCCTQRGTCGCTWAPGAYCS